MDEKRISAAELNDDPVFTCANPEETIVLAKAIDPCNLTFQNEEGEVGTLIWKDGVMRFEGNADEAAQIFFDNVVDLWTRAGGHWGQNG